MDTRAGAYDTPYGADNGETPSPAAYRVRSTLLPLARVRELSVRRPRVAMRDTAVCWALILAAWGFAALVGTWWAIALAFVVVGNRYYALFIIGHDGMHRRLFTSVADNDRFCDLLLLGPIGGIARINNRNHLKHHQRLGTADDPDRHKHGCANKSTRLAFASYLLALRGIGRTVHHAFIGRGERAETADRRPRYTPRDLAVIAGWQTLLLVGLTLTFGWWGYVLLWWAPVLVFMVLADNLRAFAEHSQPAPDAVADDQRLVTYEPAWLERQLFAPMGMNFHAAHHLWPSIPYYNLRVADAEMRRAPEASAVCWRQSYVAYLWRYFRVLPLEGCEPATAGV